MSGSEDVERFFDRLAAVAGTPPLDASETDDVLDLARVVAHEVERRFAPLTAYALGLALDASQPPAERAERARALLEAVRRLAAGEGEPDDGAGGRATTTGTGPG